ncbi:MAG: type II restriction endonuclease subunit R [Candidatus Nealsonbacteria bacterium CG_4_10_14_0_2_um_filter_37_10]|uniref:Type II restriction endonuclease subunit R n=3 Tax=Candidatus Nealsoniibacteriota TaxID=1817911 RepID=A0A2H0TJY6_9BACT|nr:MAG: type II restriction endonuclease subunit R [Candidatus Nealsonbacteria bacterium CG10_big_fil_rev_8_21_14_0_10_37_25]PIZ89692.1 MAG: type II restriction endonuclease subunit R [Candidatus Nealsonbacteria bacterium CG_4_10_14_0_2_um_filter_37_10]PJA84502.1 MAG: type II restriction endonuclease subunit R [Candidatus Nealsonbacteria bacterium CG_4_9_14_3_um_filter_37_13]
MLNHLAKIFEDKKLIDKIKKRLPYLFQLAEIESSRAGKVGMEVGSLRERIIVALLIYKFGEENVKTDIPITEPEVDVKLFNQPISIKTITGQGFSGVKLIWTVDAQKAKEFRENYYPHSDILLIQINWNSKGGFYYIPLAAQRKLFNQMGREKYIKLPKPGTNPRGVEITKEALLQLINFKETKFIEIFWQKTKVDYNPYKKWVDYWREE